MGILTMYSEKLIFGDMLRYRFWHRQDERIMNKRCLAFMAMPDHITAAIIICMNNFCIKHVKKQKHLKSDAARRRIGSHETVWLPFKC